ncbi:hypothetical protein BDV26DRAFT_282244 [Aspergillus bertholletiae]|uniref:F-box domain-containing protein n=1 Tax=Aspergillus bertholletiae TaxID=1226010 RepID=A0A5N7B4D2_9EURO|nr:hypothetical protein BDV26DRAFT_282244 [Aspergillus bertholletiae]
MPSSAEKTFGIYELAEHILLQLNDPVEIIRVTLVSWRNVIQTSSALQEACWYQSPHTKGAQMQSISGKQACKLNPAFNRIGIPVSLLDGREIGNFNLEEGIYEKPGSWMTMLATQPPCQRMLLECFSDYSGDDFMHYEIVSMTGCLFMGDIMAIIAECQNRQQRGLDRWAGVTHYTGRLARFEEDDWENSHIDALDQMANDVSINIAVELPWGCGGCAAFSLRRLHGSENFLHEMILHKMIVDDGEEYRWGGGLVAPSDKIKYKANLLVVREYQEGYLSDCRNIFRLLSDVENN